MSYQHLNQAERYQIQASKKSGYSNQQIAEQIGRSPSTICRELKKASSPGRYFAKTAHAKAQDLRTDASSRPRISDETWEIVERELRFRKSPEQVSGEGLVHVSAERIYQHIAWDKKNGGDLWKFRRRRRRRRIGATKSRQRFGGKRISQRSKRVEGRKTIGHWEADSVLGSGNKRLISLVERKSGYVKLVLVDNGSAAAAHIAIVGALLALHKRVKTITYDNGSEFAYHDMINLALDSQSFFADPHSPWQRGTNENTNGLIRQYLPKGKSMNHLTDTDIQAIEDELNARPRKRLNFQKPTNVFFASLNVALRN